MNGEPGRVETLESLEEEVSGLEERLRAAKARFAAARQEADADAGGPAPAPSVAALPSANHFLLLLSDSALPLGSFAFSSGLESMLAHSRFRQLSPMSAGTQATSTVSSSSPTALFASFLPLSLASFASSSLPFALAAYRYTTSSTLSPRSPSGVSSAISTTVSSISPSTPCTAPGATTKRNQRPPPRLAQQLRRLDDLIDAAIVCSVGRRASVAQGRALLGIWERSLAPAAAGISTATADTGVDDELAEFAKMVRPGGGGTRPTGSARADDGSDAEDDIPTQAPSAHLAPLFGAICARLGLTARQMAYIFVLGHAKALVSAAVRASVMGPYQAQKVLAGQALRDELERCIETNWETPVDLAGQTAPVVDLWMGRHELLYSRIFNS